jgi:hypothetical protein
VGETFFIDPDLQRSNSFQFKLAVLAEREAEHNSAADKLHLQKRIPRWHR